MKVVNLRVEKYERYIGRGSKFGNRFIIGKDGDRKEVIKLYRKWLWDKVREDEVFLNEVLNLKGKVLGCFCKPEGCHGDVLVSFINWYFEKEKRVL